MLSDGSNFELLALKKLLCSDALNLKNMDFALCMPPLLEQTKQRDVVTDSRNRWVFCQISFRVSPKFQVVVVYSFCLVTYYILL
jgi:hypothetical protein